MHYHSCKRLSVLTSLIAALSSLVTAGFTQASDLNWPTRPIKIVVPFAAGIAPDIVGRFVAADLSERLGQRVVVENRTGASGNIGAMSVAREQPDGYTLLLSTPNPIGLNKLMGEDIKFDPSKDFAPIIVVAKSPQVIVAGPKSQVKSLREMLELAKAKPNTLSVGIPGVGTTAHIAIEALLSLSGGSMIMVPYRGSPPVGELLGGHVDAGVGLVPSYVGPINTGQVLGLAVTSAERSKQLPNVPAAAEIGFSGFEATAWYVLAAPAGTPPDIIEKINKAVNAYIASEKGKTQFLPLDVQASGGTPAEAKAFIESEMKKWGPVIQKAHIKM